MRPETLAPHRVPPGSATRENRCVVFCKDTPHFWWSPPNTKTAQTRPNGRRDKPGPSVPRKTVGPAEAGHPGTSSHTGEARPRRVHTIRHHMYEILEEATLTTGAVAWGACWRMRSVNVVVVASRVNAALETHHTRHGRSKPTAAGSPVTVETAHVKSQMNLLGWPPGQTHRDGCECHGKPRAGRLLSTKCPEQTNLRRQDANRGWQVDEGREWGVPSVGRGFCPQG